MRKTKWRAATGPRVALLLITALAGCRHHRTDSAAAAAACEPSMSQLPAEMDLQQLNGTFAVTFVATEGSKAGQIVRGRLVLRAQDQSLVRVPNADSNTVVTQPVIGVLDLAVDDLGATRMGDLMATDAARPGVGVYVSSRRGGPVTGVIARVGSGSNVRGQMVFDGGYFTLYVGRVGSNGAWGGWASSPGTGGMVTPDARGHFCAEKQAS